jgi:hypothetical protein
VVVEDVKEIVRKLDEVVLGPVVDGMLKLLLTLLIGEVDVDSCVVEETIVDMLLELELLKLILEVKVNDELLVVILDRSELEVVIAELLEVTRVERPLEVVAVELLIVELGREVLAELLELVVKETVVDELLNAEDTAYRSKNPDPPQNCDEFPAQTILQLEMLPFAPPLEMVLPQSIELISH